MASAEKLEPEPPSSPSPLPTPVVAASPMATTDAPPSPRTPRSLSGSAAPAPELAPAPEPAVTAVTAGTDISSSSGSTIPPAAAAPAAIPVSRMTALADPRNAVALRNLLHATIALFSLPFGALFLTYYYMRDVQVRLPSSSSFPVVISPWCRDRHRRMR